MNVSRCPFEKEYAEGSGYYGSVYLEKMRFLGSLTENPNQEKNTDHGQEMEESEGLEIYDPTQDPNDHQKHEEMTKINNANWFWNFIGCANKETNLFYSQEADGIFGIMSMYESFDYRRAIERTATAEKKAARNLAMQVDKSTQKIIDKEVSEMVHKKNSVDLNTFYEDDTTPSIMNNLLVQNKVRERKFSICLGYETGYLNFDGWNARTLRILNYFDIKSGLEQKEKAEEGRILMARKNPSRTNSWAKGEMTQEWNETREMDRVRQLKMKTKAHADFDRIVEELSEKTDEKSNEKNDEESSSNSENQEYPLLEMNNVEDNAIKVLEELSGEHIIRDRIQHIKIPRPHPYSFIYSGKTKKISKNRSN